MAKELPYGPFRTNLDESIHHVGEIPAAKRKLIDKYLLDVTQTSAQHHIPTRSYGEHIPLSFQQQQVWVHSQMAGDVPIYNEAVTIYRRGPLDVAVLERCLCEILRRHEIWRTTFDTIDGKPVQIVRPAPASFPLKSIDLRYLRESDRATEAIVFPSGDAAKVFDLKQGPLLRAVLVRMGEEEYRLYMTFHQIVFDAASAYHIFLPELITLYDAFSVGRPSPLPEPMLQYGDFACWQQTVVASGNWSDQLSFWRKKLSGELPILSWPNDHARPTYQTHQGAIQRFEFDPGLISILKSFCKEQGIPSYMISLASFAAVLSRYTGQSDIVLGSLSAGRSRSEIETLIGYFVNPLALRIDLSGQPTFRQLTSRVRDTVLDALANGDVPFEKVIEAVQPRPTPDRNPIFQIVLSQQPQIPRVTQGWDLVSEEVSNGGSKLDLTVVLDERADRIAGPITYNPNLFDASTIKRLVDHWQTFLTAALANPDCSISNLPLLSDAERKQILIEWNDTAAIFPLNVCVDQLIEEQCARTPDATSIVSGHKQITYRELSRRSNQFSRYLREQGVGAGDLVGLCMDRSADLVVGMLGILKAGAAYVPIDPDLPSERLNFIAKDAGLKLMATNKVRRTQLEGLAGKLVFLDSDSDWTHGLADSLVPRSRSDAGDPAYVIYTSGSTGRPKGVCVPHRALVNFLLSMRKCPGFTKEDVLVAVTTVSFDISGLELYLPLVCGGRCVLASKDVVPDGRRLIELMNDSEASVMQATPATWRLLLESGWEGRKGLKALCGGEALPRELAQKLLTMVGSLWNMYGPTEATIWSTVQQITTDQEIITLGRPIANTQIYVLDKHLQPLPIGALGDLYIGGDGLALGYHNRPDLTAEKFLANPFRDQPDARIYKTGDIARFRPSGEIEYLGRSDDQVKIRGFRVELGEIEAVLRGHPKVDAAVVLLREDLPGDKRLVAYVVPKPQLEPVAAELGAFLKRTLPEHMIPAVFVSLEMLPLGPNGKIDRRALPVPTPLDGAIEPGFIAPRDVLETRLAEIWEETLGVRGIGIRHNLFDLGAQSLLVARILARIEREFGRKLSFVSVFGTPTIEGIAALLRGSHTSTSYTKITPIQPTGARLPFFCIGGSFFYRPLAQHLGIDQPTLAINFDESIIDRLRLPYNLEELAGYMVRAIREYQPEGPYFLGGFCDYGVIAYEAARQILNQGHRVALLALFETCNPAYLRSMSKGQGGLSWSHVSRILNKLRDQDSARLRHVWKRLFRNPSKLRPIDMDRIVVLALENYDPKPYAGRVAIFRGDTKPAEMSGWGSVITGPVEVHDVPGTHMGMFFEPYVEELVGRVVASMGKARQDRRASTSSNPA